MSFDTVADQKKFADEQNFPFPLLSDTEKSAGQAYDTIRAEGEPFAEHGIPRRYMYLVDPSGTIVGAWDWNEDRDFPNHVVAVLDKLSSLAA